MKYVVCNKNKTEFIQKGVHFNSIKKSIDEATIFNNSNQASYYEDEEFKMHKIEVKLK